MHIPLATYRCQFNQGFTFNQAREQIGYLRELGISDLYASPLFKAGPLSTHGYDICGFDRLNPNLGSEAEFNQLARELNSAGMALVMDIVPNHMGNHRSNEWWADVLKNGRESQFASYFDINWDPPNPLLKGKILLPVLGDHYAAVLERGELQAGFAEGEFFISYFDRRFPLSPASERSFGLEPGSNLELLNGQPGNPDSFQKLHQLIQQQHYRLAYWRVGPHEINYRRFFDVTDLVSVRVEDPKVFAASHELILSLVRLGQVQGLRVDHPDGLRDPKTYFEKLRGAIGPVPCIFVEKILSEGETLPRDWPIQGTTGYEYLNVLNGIFVQAENEERFTRTYEEVTGAQEDYASLAFRSKIEVLERLFISEVNALIRRLRSLAQKTRYGADFTEQELRAAINLLIAGMPVYRTYVNQDTRRLAPEEIAQVDQALEAARQRWPVKDARHLEFLARWLKLDFPGDLEPSAAGEAREFVIRFQQLSGPATAKGLEDTAFYRYTRFVSLNEVGGNPGQFGVSLDEFHEFNIRQQKNWPHSLLATSTHDTKRGEDVRARLNVLSEWPDEWNAAVKNWQQLNAVHKTNGAPSRNDEYLLYQVLTGTWEMPALNAASSENRNPSGSAAASPHRNKEYIERIQAYMQKAAREAKSNTSWTETNEAYESAVSEFIARILGSRSFLESFGPFAEKVAWFGMFNSLAQLLCKLASPGVPDIYQGTELWDLSLVDPDNRRPVDYSARAQRLSNMPRPADLLRDWRSGQIKLFTLNRALQGRAEFREVFASGEYLPLAARGGRAGHVVSFARCASGTAIITVVPRFVATMLEGRMDQFSPAVWGDTELEWEGQRFRNLLTGQEHSSARVGDLLGTFPVALLRAID